MIGEGRAQLKGRCRARGESRVEASSGTRQLHAMVGLGAATAARRRRGDVALAAEPSAVTASSRPLNWREVRSGMGPDEALGWDGSWDSKWQTKSLIALRKCRKHVALFPWLFPQSARDFMRASLEFRVGGFGGV